ncbi:MAG: hypothetical protein U0350_33470 [Caldilineaceae bacterium]
MKKNLIRATEFNRQRQPIEPCANLATAGAVALSTVKLGITAWKR